MVWLLAVWAPVSHRELHLPMKLLRVLHSGNRKKQGRGGSLPPSLPWLRGDRPSPACPSEGRWESCSHPEALRGTQHPTPTSITRVHCQGRTSWQNDLFGHICYKADDVSWKPIIGMCRVAPQVWDYFPVRHIGAQRPSSLVIKINLAELNL